jgi:hypothetical protein
VRRYALLEAVEPALLAAGIDVALPNGIQPTEAACLLTRTWYFAPSALSNTGRPAVMCARL